MWPENDRVKRASNENRTFSDVCFLRYRPTRGPTNTTLLRARRTRLVLAPAGPTTGHNEYHVIAGRLEGGRGVCRHFMRARRKHIAEWGEWRAGCSARWWYNARRSRVKACWRPLLVVTVTWRSHIDPAETPRATDDDFSIHHNNNHNHNARSVASFLYVDTRVHHPCSRVAYRHCIQVLWKKRCMAPYRARSAVKEP